MSQWGCANSPYTQTVESTFVGNQVSVTSSGEFITGTAAATSQSGSSPTGSTSSGSSSSGHSSLSTPEIIGIAIGSVIGLLVILSFVKGILYPAEPHRPAHSQSPQPGDIQLKPTGWSPPPGYSPPQVPHITNIYNHSTSPAHNNPSQPREYFGYSPHALSRENMDRFQSDYSVGHARTVGSASNDEYSEIGDLRGFSRSPPSGYGSSHAPPSEVSAPPPGAQRFLRL